MESVVVTFTVSEFLSRFSIARALSTRFLLLNLSCCFVFFWFFYFHLFFPVSPLSLSLSLSLSLPLRFSLSLSLTHTLSLSLSHCTSGTFLPMPRCKRTSKPKPRAPLPANFLFVGLTYAMPQVFRHIRLTSQSPEPVCSRAGFGLA